MKKTIKLDSPKGFYRIWMLIVSIWNAIIVLETLYIEGMSGMLSWSFLYLTILPSYLLFTIMVERSKKLASLWAVGMICIPYLHHIFKYETLKNFLTEVAFVVFFMVLVYIVGRWVINGFKIT